MIYVFDTNSLSELNAYYPGIFKEFWSRFDEMVASGDVTSTREVFPELERSGLEHVTEWAKANKTIFTTPTGDETAFVANIFSAPHFRSLIGAKQQQRGEHVADPFVIACAKVNGSTVVTEERLKPNAAKIPNVCDHFKIPWINLEGFMRAQGWSF